MPNNLALMKPRHRLACSAPLLALLLHWGILLGPAHAAAPTPTNATAASPAAGTGTAPTARGDAVAGRFAIMCAGCHSLTGAKLNGPELTPSTGWPMDQLQTAIKRMEKNVGPLTDEQVKELAEFLKAPDIRERIKAEQERIQAQFMSKMAPPDAEIGKGLFRGTVPLRNGGLACAACHTAAGIGGNLGPDLTGIFAKVGGATPLMSGIEQSGYKVMAPHYRRHPVTKQEAMHLAQYFSTLDPNQPASVQASFVPAGGGVALALFVGLVLQLRRQRKRQGRDTRLRRRRN